MKHQSVHTKSINLSIEPRYRINAVAEMIGMTAANLRIWERRYQITSPQRGKNTYRLYSEQDVALLRLMKSLCDEGHAPSEAAKVALSTFATQKQLSAKEQESAKFSRRQAFKLPGLEKIKADLISSAKRFEHREIEQILNRVVGLDSAWTVYEEIIEPALCEIGELWEQDQSYLANEHLLSHASKSTMIQLLKLLRPPVPRKKVLLACVQYELHDIPLYALALRVSHSGCLPIILGANTPPKALETAVEQIQPDIIVLSATTTLLQEEEGKDYGQFGTEMQVLKTEELIQQLQEYQKVCEPLPWLLGGQAEKTWSNLPTDLQDHISSDKLALDVLLHY